MNIKKPFVVDTAYSNFDDLHGVPLNLDAVMASPNPPDAIIAKAGEYWNGDINFGAVWTSAKRLGIPRAAYWYYRNSVFGLSAGQQARIFSKILLKYGFDIAKDYIVIDDEEKDNAGRSKVSTREMLDFLYNCQVSLALADTKRMLIYSTSDILNNLSFAKLNPAQAAWLKSVRVWLAGYPLPDADAYETAEQAGYKLNSNWGEVVMWQYAGDYNLDKKLWNGAVDLNVVYPAFWAEWSGGSVGGQPADPELIRFNEWIANHPNATQYDIWRGAKGLA